MFILDPDLDPSRISDPTADTKEEGGNICCLLKMLAETLPFSMKIRVEQQKYNNSVFTKRDCRALGPDHEDMHSFHLTWSGFREFNIFFFVGN
jgi:hypothetical protein